MFPDVGELPLVTRIGRRRSLSAREVVANDIDVVYMNGIDVAYMNSIDVAYMNAIDVAYMNSIDVAYIILLPLNKA